MGQFICNIFFALNILIQLTSLLAYTTQIPTFPNNNLSEVNKKRDPFEARSINTLREEYFLNKPIGDDNPERGLFQNASPSNSSDAHGTYTTEILQTVHRFKVQPRVRSQDVRLNQSGNHQVQSKSGRMHVQSWSSENTLEKTIGETTSNTWEMNPREGFLDDKTMFDSYESIGHTKSHHKSSPFSKVSLKKLLSERNPSKLLASLLSSPPVKELLEQFLDRLLREGDRLLRDLESDWNPTSEDHVESEASADGSLVPTVGKHSDAAEKKTVLSKGRSKKKDSSMMMSSLMLSAGTIMALGFLGVALLAGKALLTSLIAITIAIVTSFRGMMEKKTHFEVHAKPYYTHEDTHSSELLHSHGGYN